MADFVQQLPQRDRRLGRNIVHDERSRAYARQVTVDRLTWRDKAIRIYDPYPNPNQCHGECTGCAKMTQLNAVGNRRMGYVLSMPEAHRNYARNTEIDPWPGTFTFAYPTGPAGGDDTGSSGLASCKSAVEHGIGGEYRWLFGGADEVVQTVHDGLVVSVGTRWDWDMFYPDGDNRIHPGGGMAGGHQYVVRGYRKSRDWVLIRCWWGAFRDVWLARSDLAELLADHGDAHVQVRR